MQAAVGHPLTIYGTGEQTRAFININDTVKCVDMAIEHPPIKGEKVKVFNQTSECHNLKELADKIVALTEAKIRYYKNPRNEDPKNDLKFVNEGFKSLGWNPVYLKDGLLSEITQIAEKYSSRCDMQKIICTSVWDKNKKPDFVGGGIPK